MPRHFATRTLSALIFVGAAGAAQAGLEICNDSGTFQSVAIGYPGAQDWTSEGWWLLEPGACITPIEGDLQSRYYYYRAESDGAEFAGQGYAFCTDADAFTIVGDTDCAARGYAEDDFAEIDTGETAASYVLRLAPVAARPATDTEVTAPAVAETTPVSPPAVTESPQETVAETVTETAPETVPAPVASPDAAPVAGSGFTPGQGQPLNARRGASRV